MPRIARDLPLVDACDYLVAENYAKQVPRGVHRQVGAAQTSTSLPTATRQCIAHAAGMLLAAEIESTWIASLIISPVTATGKRCLLPVFRTSSSAFALPTESKWRI